MLALTSNQRTLQRNAVFLHSVRQLLVTAIFERQINELAINSKDKNIEMYIEE
jgi:hypothetical protein